MRSSALSGDMKVLHPQVVEVDRGGDLENRSMSLIEVSGHTDMLQLVTRTSDADTLVAIYDTLYQPQKQEGALR